VLPLLLLLLLLLGLLLLLPVPAVILSEGQSPKSKDPEELNQPPPFEPFSPYHLPPLLLQLPCSSSPQPQPCHPEQVAHGTL
jgi:hypothetical protein